MSLCNVFIMETGLTTYEVVDILAEALPFVEYVTTDEDLSRHNQKWKDIVTTNKVTNFTVMDCAIGQQNFEEVFGFSPDVKLIFEMNKTAKHYETSHAEMLQTAVCMLRKFSGDAALFLGHSDATGFRRKNGEIFLSSKERELGNWRDIDLANFTLPYEWAELPDPYPVEL